MSTQHNQNRLTAEQKQQFHEDGFLFVRDLLPNEALQPLIDELAERVDDGTRAAVKHGILDPSDTYNDAPFEKRLGRVSNACSDPNWICGATISGTRRFARLGCSHSELHPRSLMSLNPLSVQKF